MKRTLPFYFVDVFAIEPLTGNPAVVVDGGADETDEVLGRIAKEFNQSETTFVLPAMRPGADWRLRSFTPAGIEVFGVGHVVTGRVPCQVVSTGAAHLLVPVRDREAVDRLRPDSRALLSVLEAAGGEGCYVFSLDPRQADAIAYARFFNPTVGIVEDPATGTAAGPLAAHLVAHGVARPGQPLRIEQGTAVGRTSVIQVEVHDDAVRVSGRAVIVASGTLFL
jgi:predicted PhzF superfamily epimerase YddE/YHI9